MIQNKLKKKPLVLLPEGPYGWSSHQYIVPELIEVWSSLGFDILPIWYPEHKWQFEELEKVAHASVLIFPLGYSHYRGLQTLSVLRTGYNIKTPACLMYTSDINTGMRYLALAESVLRPTDCLVVNCSSEARLLKAFFPKSKLQIHEIALPVNEALFSFREKVNRNKLRRALGLAVDKKLLLYAGRISAQKNIVSLLAVARQLKEVKPDFKLIVLGDADEVGVPHFQKKAPRRYIVNISEAISSLGLADAVEFRPSVSQNDLADYFNACDAHVSLTVHSGEDFGYSIAQGLACGIPTVVTNWGGGVDLGSVCHNINVATSVAGPIVDHPAAFKKLVLALEQGHKKNSSFSRRFSKKAIADCWLKIDRHYNKLKSPEFSTTISTLGHFNLPTKKYFANGEDKNFKKYAMAYTQQKAGLKFRFHTHPLFFYRLKEIPEAWNTDLKRMSPDDKKALKKFIAAQYPTAYFDRVPGLSSRGKQFLLELGALCPSVKASI